MQPPNTSPFFGKQQLDWNNKVRPPRVKHRCSNRDQSTYLNSSLYEAVECSLAIAHSLMHRWITTKRLYSPTHSTGVSASSGVDSADVRDVSESTCWESDGDLWATDQTSTESLTISSKSQVCKNHSNEPLQIGYVVSSGIDRGQRGQLDNAGASAPTDCLVQHF